MVSKTSSPAERTLTRPASGAASASEMVPDQRGASPLGAHVLRPVTDSNCVVARPGGEQLEVNDQSATKVNSIRPGMAASLLANDEAQTPSEIAPGDRAEGKSAALKGNVSKRRRSVSGVWRPNGRKVRYSNQRDLSGKRRCSLSSKGTKSRRAGVRAFIVGTKRRNGRGPKGRRKVEA